MTRLDRLEKFLEHKFTRRVQTFFERNWVGDCMTTIYNDDGIIVDYCPNWEYIEIFGVTSDEQLELRSRGWYE